MKQVGDTKPAPPPKPVLLRLRTDLNFWLRQDDRAPYYLVEDPLTGRYYRLGVHEWQLASALDGRRSLAEILAHWRTQLGNTGPTDEQAVTLCRWLISSQLALAAGPDGLPANWPVARPPGRAGFDFLSNPLLIRIPLLNPDRFLAALLPWLQWMLSPAFFVVWLLLCLAGSYQVMAQWDRFTAAASAVIAPHNWLFLLGAWLGLKVVHETFHGLACKRYGGTVPCAGLVLILFSPVAFVDVTSCWRFGSKWQRIFTAGAGMYSELGIAAVAAIVWSRTGAGPANHVCHCIVLMASLTTLLFNANPLMRLDGYYILSDLWEIQNLYASGRQYLRYFFLRWFFGVRISLPPWTRFKGLAIRIYAWASLGWRLMVSVSLILVAGTLFRGAGLVLAAMAVAAWFGRPVGRLMCYVWSGDAQGRPSLARFVLTAAACAALAWAVLRLPWPGGATAPGVVEYAPLHVVRASSDGFVRQVLVQTGQYVRPGQTLAVLVNEQLQRDLGDLQLAIQQSVITSRVLHRGTDMGKYQIEMEHQHALVKKQSQLQKQLGEMTPRALAPGRVVAPHLDSLVGTYVTAGTPLMVIGAEHKKEIRLSISEQRLESFTRAIRTASHVRVRGRGPAIRGARLSKIEPQASVNLDHPALAAASGGPLAVRHVSDDDGSSDTDAREQLQLVAPRFTGIIALPEDVSRSLRSGQLVRARLIDRYDTMGRRLYDAASRWVRGKLQRARPS